MRRFFHCFAAVVNLGLAALLVVLALMLGPSRLEAESAGWHIDGGGPLPDADSDASEPRRPDATSQQPAPMDSGCSIAAAGGRTAASLPVVALALTLAASQRRRKR